MRRRHLQRPERQRPCPRWTVAAVLSLALLLTPLLAGCGGGSHPRPTPPTPPAPTRPVTGIAYGDRLVWMSDADLAAALDTAVQVGATLVRADLSWDDIQHNGPGDYAWHLFDRVVAAADARGLSVLPVLTATPPWARSPGCTEPACGPHDAARFAAFAAAAAQRYAPRGVHDWELWNEPNLTTFWAPAADPAGYAATVKAGAAALHHADPHAFVVLGGLAPTDSGHGDLAPTAFLAEVAQQGATRVVDAVGYHPYCYPYLPSASTSFGTAWEQIDRTKESLRSVLTQAGTPRLPIWLTEFGAPTGGPGAASDGSPGDIGPGTTHVTEARQAEIAADGVRTAAADPGIGALIWYTDRDNPAATGAGAGGSTEDWYGLRRADGSAKPALAALRSAITQLRASTDASAAPTSTASATTAATRGPGSLPRPSLRPATALGTVPGSAASGRARRSARRRAVGPRCRSAQRCRRP